MKNGERMRSLTISEINKMNYQELTYFLTAVSGIEQIKNDVLKITHDKFEKECISGLGQCEEFLDKGIYYQMLEEWYNKEEIL